VQRSCAAYGFDAPFSIASDGTHVWVGNLDNNTVTEINATTGAPFAVLSGASYGFDIPRSIAVHGNRVWVTNTYD
jgi:DNA-binding beta-propeller fold protein YncE